MIALSGRQRQIRLKTRPKSKYMLLFLGMTINLWQFSPHTYTTRTLIFHRNIGLSSIDDKWTESTDRWKNSSNFDLLSVVREVVWSVRIRIPVPHQHHWSSISGSQFHWYQFCIAFDWHVASILEQLHSQLIWFETFSQSALWVVNALWYPNLNNNSTGMYRLNA